uniref:BCAS3 domain-containing protein n=1 Tax=Angiostrongylus cantonensis TaxID=6313 RepID=A0A0K0DBY5_ANGCA
MVLPCFHSYRAYGLHPYSWQNFELGCMVRSVRCTGLGSGSSLVFVAGYNPVSLTSKRSIASLCISSCGNFTGIGTMGGSVLIYDTHEMKQCIAFKDTHGIFVTAVEFLDRTSTDVLSLIPQPTSGNARQVPGPGSCARASIISLSADQTIQNDLFIPMLNDAQCHT